MEHIYLEECQENAADIQRAKIDEVTEQLLEAVRELNRIVGSKSWEGKASLGEGYAITMTFKADDDKEFTGITFGFDKKNSADHDAMIAHASYCLEVGLGMSKELGIWTPDSKIKPLKG